MTAPAPARVPDAQPAAPSFAGGLLLNLLLPGAGFTLIGVWAWHLGWAALMVVVWVAATLLLATAGASGLLLVPLATAAMLWHYTAVYRQRAAQYFQPPLATEIKIALWVGHFLLGIFLVGILAAVLIPNLLSARTRAVSASERATVQHIYIQTVARSLDGTLQSGPCPADLLAGVGNRQTQVTACTVDTYDPVNPGVTVTFSSGRTLTQP